MAAEQRLLELIPNEQVTDYAPSREALKLIRESRLHRPTLVLNLVTHAIPSVRRNTLEYWDILEQQANAAAEVGNWDVLKAATTAICARFAPSASSRARLTHGLRREAYGQYDAATRTYIEILADDASYNRAYKRQVALLKCQRRIPEAIAQCNYYLSYFATDRDAWAELSALCLQANRAAHALYAANELVLCDPNNHAAHTLVADIYLTSGARDDIVLARKHYAASLAARKFNNLRALYGLWYAASLIDALPGISEEESAHNLKLLNWAKSHISEVYAGLSDSTDYDFALEMINQPLPSINSR